MLPYILLLLELKKNSLLDRGFCYRGSIVPVIYIIIHSKYFPNSDWLEAHA